MILAKPMSTYVFTGPTLSPAVAQKYLKATYLGPAAQGDILRILSRRPRVIGIIDGVFEFVPSIWHKEILLALQDGVRVYGAASMGALRAAELVDFGMEGVGEIFKRFRSGEFEDDDEVAVTFGPEEIGYRSLSEAMVDIRDVCKAAVSRNVIDADVETRISAIAKHLHFRLRRWDLIEQKALSAGIQKSAIEKLQAFRKEFGMGLKQRDAIELLQTIRSQQQHNTHPKPAYRVEQTIFLTRLQQEVNRELSSDIEAPGGPVDVARKKVLLGLLAAREASRSGFSPQEDEIRSMSDWFRRTYDLEDDRVFAQWLINNNLHDDAFDHAVRRFACVVKMEEVTRDELASEVDQYLKLYGAAANHQAAQSQWVQLNIALERDTAEVRLNANAFFRALLQSIPNLGKAGQPISFHFTRKHPDIRLRLHSKSAAAMNRLVPQLELLFKKMQRRRMIESVTSSVYEPEYRRFGGKQAMAACHDYFHADSLNWIFWNQIRQSRRRCQPETLVGAVLNDLFLETLNCSAEVWDVWYNLLTLTQGPDVITTRSPDVPSGLRALRRSVSEEERAILSRYNSANRALARQLNTILASGDLSVGLRSVLAVIAMFQCNRFGIDGRSQALLAQSALRLWDPERTLLH